MVSCHFELGEGHMDTASRDEARFEDFTGLIAAINKEVTRI